MRALLISVLVGLALLTGATPALATPGGGGSSQSTPLTPKQAEQARKTCEAKFLAGARTMYGARKVAKNIETYRANARTACTVTTPPPDPAGDTKVITDRRGVGASGATFGVPCPSGYRATAVRFDTRAPGSTWHEEGSNGLSYAWIQYPAGLFSDNPPTYLVSEITCAS